MIRKIVIAACLALPALTVLAGELPDSKLTPGDTLDVTAKQVCRPGYAGRTRAVSYYTKSLVYKRYGLTSSRDTYCKQGCEVDHLISLELGGSNDITNLWPQPYVADNNAHMKDKLEDKLHQLVCSGKLSLPAAQQIISKDWITGYKQYVPAKPMLLAK